MNLKHTIIGIVAAAVIVLWFSVQHERADAALADFYSQMASARFGEARESIEKAIRLWRSNARYYSWRAYSESQSLPSQCPRNHQQGSSMLTEEDRSSAEQARLDYRRSLALNNRDPVAHHNIAWIEHLLGNDSSAAEQWKESIELDPDNAVFHLSYGMYLEEGGNQRAAKEQYVIAITLVPSILDSEFFSRYRIRSPAMAESVVAECIAKTESRLGEGNDPILSARLGKMYLYHGNLDRSEKLLEDAAAQLPNLPLVWFNLGEISLQQGDTAHATLDYRRATTIDASLAQTHLRLGELGLRFGDKNGAFHDLNVAIQRWEHANPITARHNNRLYGGPRQTIDDLLPTTLLWYVTPCAASGAWRALSELYPQRAEYRKRIRTCEELPAPHAGLADVSADYGR